MNSVLIIALLFLSASAITCHDTYYGYLHDLLTNPSVKCWNMPPFTAENPCMSDATDAFFEEEYLTHIDECNALDPTIPYHELTQLTDFPESHLAVLSRVYYTYTNSGPVSYNAVEEEIESHNFGIVPHDDYVFDGLLSYNDDSPDFYYSMSWVSAVKYVIDYWMKQYKVITQESFTTNPDYTVSSKFIWQCLATGVDEQLAGIPIETLFERVNEIGVGESYNPAHVTNCNPTPLTGNKRFIITPLVNKNRGGLIKMVQDGYLPVVPIAFDLNALRWFRTMDSTTATPIIRTHDNPSLIAVLNGFSTTAVGGAYWEVIANVFPEMSTKLVLSMTDNVQNQNSHGIAAFAVGIKLDLETTPRRLRE